MTITLYHCDGSRSMRPIWTMEEMGIDYELVTMRFPARDHHKEFKAINPLGTVPYFVDGDLVMTESTAMCQYLVERYGPSPLAVSPDESDYPNYLNWLHRSDATLTFPLALIYRYRDLEPDERKNPQVVADYIPWYLNRSKSIETALADREYLCAGRFTIADIAVGFSVHFALFSVGLNEVLRPNTARWWDQLTERDAYRKLTKNLCL